MDGEDVIMEDAPPPLPAKDLPSRLLDARRILLESAELSHGHTSEHANANELVSTFTRSDVKPLAIYRAAACLREAELRELVQLMVFAGPTAFLPALRFLNIMRGLPGNWELTMELLEQQDQDQIAEIGPRAMTLLGLLGGKKAYYLCDWSPVIQKALENGHEESRLAMHMVLEKKWTGSIESVYRINDWKGEVEYAATPTIWREMQWATYARARSGQVPVCEESLFSHTASSQKSLDGAWQCFEYLPEDFGPVGVHYMRVAGTVVRRRLVGSGTSADRNEKIDSSLQQQHVDSTTESEKDDFVITSSLHPVIRALAGALCYGVPIVLEGTSGCGKTSIISFLGRKTLYKRPAHKSEVPGVTFIQMDSTMSDADGDSFDSLIGVIVPLPDGRGFHWRPGPIGLAIERGEWLVFENLGQMFTRSSSAIPIIAKLAALRPGDDIAAPGRGQPLRAGKGFRCIATRTVSEFEKDDRWEPPGGWEVWDRVSVPALSQNEKVEMLKRRYPLVKDCVPRVVKATEAVAECVRSNRGPLTRDSTLREAVRICTRLNTLRAERTELLTVENALLETIDVLVAWCLAADQRRTLLEIVSTCWSLPYDVATDLDSQHRPSFSREGVNLRIGRSSMPILANNDVKVASRLTMTGYTLRVLERVLRCLQVEEHVLLTGEAGSGKTAVIQEIAAFLRTKLMVVNLSRQSELGDLMGAFRPVEMAAAVPLLAKKFEEAFCLTMSRRKNGRFLDALQSASRCVEGHSRAIRLMQGAAAAIPKSAKNANHQIAEKWLAITEELANVSRSLVPSLRVVVAENSDGKAGHGVQNAGEPPRKRRKGGLLTSEASEHPDGESPKKRTRSKRRVDFRFSEGVLAQAMRGGYWILLDEINLAPAEFLERLVSVVDRGQVQLPDEAGSVLTKSEGFRLFAAMNPPTDVGKRPLPGVLRARFSEFHCGDMLDKRDIVLMALHRFYGLKTPLDECTDQMRQEMTIAEDIGSFFLKCSSLGREGRLEEASGKPIRFSLRTLSRMLDFASGIGRYMKRGERGVRRALFEGAILSFATPLPTASRALVCEVAMSILLQGTSQSRQIEPLSAAMTIPADVKCHVKHVEGFPLEAIQSRKPLRSQDHDVTFVISPTVRKTLQDVCRALSLGTRRLPIVLQGPTAAGKTSLVTYLANITGNNLVRINNHEHTDLAEYLGGYVATPSGSLVFHEGPLVQAARNGSWVLLDELNLAPPEVLESLNRLLDDNREILLPETGQVVKAAPGFTVFATQNPPGLYGGRKELSRAFRSRFVEVQVPDLTDDDLLTILEQRCNIPPSFAKKMIAVMRELQLRRRTTSLFSGRDGFVTARDLFRWASRGPRSKEELAVHGFLLLAERSRRSDEKEIVRNILLKAIGVENGVLEEDTLYSFEERATGKSPSQECFDFSLQKLSLNREDILGALTSEGIVPTSHMRRMITLLIHGIANSEPVLLVGSTGGGKTSCCSVICHALGSQLLTVNCHQHTEASDIIGSFRPARSMDADGPLFEWVDGPLVHAMKQGSIALIDEINMAEDAVIERLNSVLELERTILLSEKGAVPSARTGQKEMGLVSEEITADVRFRILATMNPGGDYGKKELSPALRNRFTEVWVPPASSLDEFSPIVRASLSSHDSFLKNEHMQLSQQALCDFLQWFLSEFPLPGAEQSSKVNRYVGMTPRLMLSVRDVSTWCEFIGRAFRNTGLDPLLALVHGARLVFLDGLAVGSTGAADTELEAQVWRYLISLLPVHLRELAEAAKFGDAAGIIRPEHDETEISSKMKFGWFAIPRNETSILRDEGSKMSAYSFDAPCTVRNSARLARAMAVGKRPILLEGPPGCGKSSLVTALASAAGFPFVRINLSDSTEMSDLVGSESPGEVPGSFAFRAGPLLNAIQSGSWVLLDELNLASQSVLEGLNSVLDHRRSLFVPELSREVRAHATFRVFGAQNPACEGGGRRSLPKSFLNRFTRVHMEAPTREDILFILSSIHPLIAAETASKIVDTLHEVKEGLQTCNQSVDMSSFGLRDALRWCDLYNTVRRRHSRMRENVLPNSPADKYHLGLCFDVVILQGLKEGQSRALAELAFHRVFGFEWHSSQGLPALISSDQRTLRLGQSVLRGSEDFSFSSIEPCSSILLPSQLRELQALSFAVDAGWPAVVCSEDARASPIDGIRLIYTLATLYGKTVNVVHGGALSDCDEFMGGYCQQDVVHVMQKLVKTSEDIVFRCLYLFVGTRRPVSDDASLNTVITIRTYAKKLRSVLGLVTANNCIADGGIAEFLQISGMFMDVIEHVDARDIGLDGHLHSMGQMLLKLKTLRCATGEDGFASFEWKKSDFVEAIEAGEWILLRDADTCPPAILDRLNPLLERPALAMVDGKAPNPSSSIAPVVLAEAPANEDGSPVLLKPHPEFRIFFSFASQGTSSAQKGLSRALLDRSLKVSTAPSPTVSECAGVDSGCSLVGKHEDYVRPVASSPSCFSTSAAMTRFQIATGRHPLVEGTLDGRTQREEALQHRSTYECLTNVPRTFAANLALNPRHELIERELTGLQVMENLSFSEIDALCGQVISFRSDGSCTLSPSSDIPIDINEESLRSWLLLAAAEGFILASQSFHDLRVRCEVLRKRAELSAGLCVKGSYDNVASIGEQWSLANDSKKHGIDDSLGEEPMLPVDPLYACDTPSTYLATGNGGEESRTASTRAVQFRTSIVAIQAFQSSWRRASTASGRGFEETVFAKAKLAHAVRATFTSHSPGNLSVDIICYEVLSAIVSIPAKVYEYLSKTNEWSIPEERRLIKLFVSAREVCESMADAVHSDISELHPRLVDIMESAKAIQQSTNGACYGLSHIATMEHLEELDVIQICFQRDVLLMPRTERGQQAESDMLTVYPYYARGMMSFREVDGFVKGLVSLSAENVDGDKDIIAVLGKVTETLSKRNVSANNGLSRVLYWTQAALSGAVNLLREVVLLLKDFGPPQSPPQGSGHVFSTISRALFYIKCVPGAHLGSAVSLQRLRWLLDNVNSKELPQLAYVEIQAAVMSSLLAENSAISLTGISSEQQSKEAEVSERGMASNLFMFAEDSSQLPFWGLLTARREAASAAAWVIAGSHDPTEKFEQTCQLLITSLHSAMRYCRILSVQQIDVLQSGKYIESLDLLLRQTRKELEKFEKHSDIWELCHFQADALMYVRVVVSNRSSDLPGERLEIPKQVCEELSRKGAAWLSLGLLRLRGYHVHMKRKNGIDPSQIARSTAQLNLKRSIRARVGISAYSILGNHRLGGDLTSETTPICRLEDEYAESMDLFSEAEKRYVFRPGDRPSFSSLLATVDTVNAVITDKIARSKLIQRLVSVLERSEVSSQLAEEALDLFQSCATTAENLGVSGTLSHFRDLTTELSLGLREVQYGLVSGLRCSKLEYLCAHEVTAKRIHTFCDITMFPRAAFHVALTVSDALRSYESAGISSAALMACATYLIDSEVRSVSRINTDLSRALSYIVDIWKKSSLLEEEKNKKKNSMHILREAGSKGEVPGQGFIENLEFNEEQDFNNTFNLIKDDEEDDLLGLNRTADMTNELDQPLVAQVEKHRGRLDCEAFWNIHVKVFPGREIIDLERGEVSSRFAVVKSLSKHLHHMSDGIHPVTDHVPTPWHMFSAVDVMHMFEANTISRLSNPSMPEDKQASGIDFYRDANPDEVSYGSKALRNLQKAVCQVQKEFFEDTGDHPVLGEISLAIQRVADTCNISSPLSRVVIGVENVLRKADEWRRLFATSAMRMDNEVLALSRVAARWRRLERASWRLLLRNRVKSMERRASNWFFYLYDALIHETSSIAKVPNEGAGQNIVSVVDQFLRSSPSGEFARRLEMLLSLGSHILSVSRTDNSLMSTIGCSLRGIGRYYSLFVPVVSHELSRATELIEAKLGEFSKILSWNPDVSLGASQKMSKEHEKHLEYYRLKEAAQRTKRKLHKLCLEMDAVLRVPVYEHLTKEIQRIGFETLTSEKEECNISGEGRGINNKTYMGQRISISVDELVQHLSSSCLTHDDNPPVSDAIESEKQWLSKVPFLELRLVQFGRMVENSSVSVCGSAVNFCRETRSAIRSRALQLRQSQNLGVQPKKRALVDLMKGLRRAGLSPFENQVPTARKEPLFWLSSPDPSENPSYNKVANELFCVAAQQLRRLREVSDSRIRNTDITGDEAQKSRALCAHLFDMACLQRTSLNNLLTDIVFITDASSQLQEVNGEVDASKNHRWNDTACAYLLDIITGLRKIMVDLEVALSSITFALEASHKHENFNTDGLSESLIQDQLPRARALSQQVATVLSNAVESLRKTLRSEECARFERRFGRETRSLAPISCHEEVLELIRNLKTELDEQLLQARALSDRNIAVQVLAPTTDFLRVSVEKVQTNLLLQPVRANVASEDLIQRIEELYEALVERTMVGAQNVLVWSKVSGDSGSKNQGVIANLGDGEDRKHTSSTQKLLRNAHDDILAFGRISNIPAIADILKELIKLKSSTGTEKFEGQRGAIGNGVRSLPNHVSKFVDTYIRTMILPCVSKVSLIHCHSLALLKTVSSVFVGVCSEGFCRPGDVEEETDQGDGVAEKTGTGFGDVGDGDVGAAQDVSEQIEDEEQLLGLQSDVPEADGQKQQNQSEQEQGFEMTTDFDGDLEDHEPLKDDNNKESEADEKPDEKGLSTEDGYGKDVIDEKLWDEGDDPPKQGSTEDDMANAGGEGEQTELAPKSMDDPAGKEQKTSTKPSRDETHSPDDGEVDKSEKETESREEREQEHHVDLDKDKSLQKSETGDDDEENEDIANKEGSECKARDKPTGEEHGEDEAPEMDPEGRDCSPDHLLQEKDDDSAPVTDNREDDDNDVPMSGTGDDFEQNEGAETGKDGRHSNESSDCEMGSLSLDEGYEGQNGQGDSADDMENDKFDTFETGEDDSGPQAEITEEPSGVMEEEEVGDLSNTENEEVTSFPEMPRGQVQPAVQATTPKDSGTRTTNQQTSSEPMGNASSAFPAPDHTTVNADFQEDSGKHGDGEGAMEGPANAGPDRSNAENLQGHDNLGQSKVSNDVRTPDPNPFRVTVKDEIISSWSKYLEVIEQEKDKVNQGRRADEIEEDGIWEFQEEGDSDTDGKVALGAATEEQHRTLPGTDHEDEDIEKGGEATTQEQEPLSNGDAPVGPRQHSMSGVDDKVHEVNPSERVSSDARENNEQLSEPQRHPARIAAESDRGRPQTNLGHPEVGLPRKREETKKTEIADSEDEMESNENHPEDKMEAGDNRLKWNVEDLEEEDATHLWKKLTQLSAVGASSLSEQLRLVLEPTVASRLAGGYRTGKRLNIRKVIEFVASDFRKDRIWLRRVRPDKRSYDVLLAIDDSESMSESEAGPMALESLALVTSALAKLEIGRVAVASFGAEAHMVRGFNEPLPMSDKRGGELLQHFCFSQKETDIAKLLQFIQATLVGVQGSEEPEQIKLAFVISDGRLSGREEIKQRLRRLREANVLVAFLIVDKTCENETSIYDVRRVEYDANGKIQVLPYMQDFPIEFYAVVQDVQLLPTVLADALRQWVEVTSSLQ